MLAYWFVLQCNKGDTDAIILNAIDARNNESGSNKIVGLKFWVGQHPNETAYRDTILIKFINPICKKKCEQIFDGRKVIFACKNTIDDEKTRTILRYGNFVIAGPHLKNVLFRTWSKKSKKKTVEDVALEHEQHVLLHPTCITCREIEVATQLLVEKEKLTILINEREAVSAEVTNMRLTANHLQETIMEERKMLEATRKEREAVSADVSNLRMTASHLQEAIMDERKTLEATRKEREAVSADVTNLRMTASHLQETILEERKNLEESRKILASLAMCTLHQGCTGDRGPIGKRGLDAGPSYPVYRKQSEFVLGQDGLYALKNISKNEVVARMDEPVPLTSAQEAKLSQIFQIRHDSVVSMGLENNSVWDLNVSKNLIGTYVEPMWYYMNHRKEANANVLLHFESKDSIRFPVWKAKHSIKVNEELFFDYGVVPDSFKE